MRVLLDECLPRRLRRSLPGHDVVTVVEAGWGGKLNGELLRAITGNVDAFVTIDKNLTYQQNLKSITFGIVVLMAENRLAALLPLAPKILAALQDLKAGQVVRVGA